MQLPDELQPTTLLDNDPVIKAARGFRFECHPMRAVLPQQA
jgi:hypothetical protein